MVKATACKTVHRQFDSDQRLQSIMARQPLKRQFLESTYGKAGLQRLVYKARSVSNLVELVGWNKRSGSSMVLMRDILVEWGIDTSHLRGQGARTRGTFSSLKTDYRRKLRLIVERGHRCQVCHREDWMGKQIPIEIDHIDGHCTNNLKSNLRLICPNCHAQTPTYKGKNKGNVSGKRKEAYKKHPIQKYRDQ